MNPIPGEAGVDYPVFNSVPDTSFDCTAQENPGIYTDTEARCQSFYMCTPAGESAAFLCPNGSLNSTISLNFNIFLLNRNYLQPAVLRVRLVTISSPLLQNVYLYKQFARWYNIDCDQQPSFYSLNELLNQEQDKPNCQTLFCKDD